MGSRMSVTPRFFFQNFLFDSLIYQMIGLISWLILKGQTFIVDDCHKCRYALQHGRLVQFFEVGDCCRVWFAGPDLVPGCAKFFDDRCEFIAAAQVEVHAIDGLLPIEDSLPHNHVGKRRQSAWLIGHYDSDAIVQSCVGDRLGFERLHN